MSLTEGHTDGWSQKFTICAERKDRHFIPANYCRARHLDDLVEPDWTGQRLE